LTPYLVTFTVIINKKICWEKITQIDLKAPTEAGYFNQKLQIPQKPISPHILKAEL